MADALSVINNLRSVSFDWKASSGYKAPDGGISDFGLIAEEVNQYRHSSFSTMNRVT